MFHIHLLHTVHLAHIEVLIAELGSSEQLLGRRLSALEQRVRVDGALMGTVFTKVHSLLYICLLIGMLICACKIRVAYVAHIDLR